jgi:hypothetical protein
MIFLKIFARKEPYYISQGSSLRIVHEREACVTEIILDTWSKYLVSEELDHDVGSIECDEFFFFVTTRF